MIRCFWLLEAIRFNAICAIMFRIIVKFAYLLRNVRNVPMDIFLTRIISALLAITINHIVSTAFKTPLLWSVLLAILRIDLFMEDVFQKIPILNNLLKITIRTLLRHKITSQKLTIQRQLLRNLKQLPKSHKILSKITIYLKKMIRKIISKKRLISSKLQKQRKKRL